MRRTDRPEDRPGHVASASLTKRLAWFVAIWAGSILALGVVAYGIRLMIL